MNRQLAAQAALCLALFNPPWPMAWAVAAEPQDRDAALRALEQQQRDEMNRRQRAAPVLSAAATAPRQAPQLGESPCFVIHEFRPLNLRPLQAADIDPEFTAFRGRCLGAASLEALRGNLNLRLAELGYVTSRATIPEQALDAGTLEIGFEIGRVGALREQAEGAQRPGRWQHALSLRPGDALNVRALDQSLDQFNRLPSQRARFVVEPGDVDGSSIVTLQRDLQTPWRWNATLDNAGPREYGRAQAGLQLGWDDPCGWLDQLFVSLTTNLPAASDGSRNQGISATYSVPWRDHLLSASASQTIHAHHVQGTSVAFESRGNERHAELKWQWAAWRDASRRFGAWVAASRDESHSFIDDTEVLVQQRSTATLEEGISLTWRAQAAEFSLDLSQAQTRRMGANPFLDGGPSHPRTRQLRIGLSTPIALPGDVTGQYLAQVAAQTVRGADIGTPRMTLGGRNTVRGFDGDSTLAGESGISLRQEWRLAPLDGPWPGTAVAPYLALDAGAVRGPSARGQGGRTLAGAAIGLRWSAPGFDADLALAAPLRQPAHFMSRSTALYLSLGFHP